MVDDLINTMLKNVRLKRNLSQEKFGFLIGLSNKTLSKYERGVLALSIYNLKHITKTLKLKYVIDEGVEYLVDKEKHLGESKELTIIENTKQDIQSKLNELETVTLGDFMEVVCNYLEDFGDDDWGGWRAFQTYGYPDFFDKNNNYDIDYIRMNILDNLERYFNFEFDFKENGVSFTLSIGLEICNKSILIDIINEQFTKYMSEFEYYKEPCEFPTDFHPYSYIISKDIYESYERYLQDNLIIKNFIVKTM